MSEGRRDGKDKALLIGLSGIDYLLNNAGAGGALKAIDEIEIHGWDRTMALLLRSVALGIRHGVPHMRCHPGATIVNTSSVAAFDPGY